MLRTIVIGGGPGGMMAAIAASKQGESVTIIEKNEKLGKKMFITGKGRCNVTNDCEAVDYFKHVMKNPKFMYSSFYTFDNNALMRFFEDMGVELKTERGGRVFPASNKSSDLIRAMERKLKELDVGILLRTKVQDIVREGDAISGVIAGGNRIDCDRVIFSSGGVTYPGTGADNSGIMIVESLGHNIVNIEPSLISMRSDESWVKDLQGLALRNVTLSAYQNEKKLYSELGEMLFTHFGVSGPLVLTASTYAKGDKGIHLSIDMKPALSVDKLDARMMRDLAANPKRQIKTLASEYMPMSLIPSFLLQANVQPDKICAEMTKQERMDFINTLKDLKIPISGFRDINEAIIMRGGVDTKEINPSTMESKIVKNLYFVGEMIDVDAKTGGFNMQIAFSTGYLAGISGGKC